MKICAIICEYNPFHYGHLNNLKKAKELSGADAIMCIMSGNFTQRADPTIVNKYVRATMALEAGADIVVQMPTAYACSSAEIYALAGVKIANSFDQVTNLAFGCETKNFALLQEIAHYLANEPKEYQDTLQKYLDEGNSIAVSRQKALEELIKTSKVSFSEITETINILQQPNNILAIEYLKALIRTNSKIEPVFINRGNSEYHSEDVNGKDTSATAIRSRLLKHKKACSIKRLVPKSTYRLLKEEMKVFGLPSMKLYSDLCMYVLKTSTAEDYTRVFDVSEGLENRFVECSQNTKELGQLLLEVKSKRFSYTRLKRIVLRMLLGIDKYAVEELYKATKLPYIKVLGFNSARKDILSSVECSTNLIIRNSNVVENPSKYYTTLNAIEEHANAVYNLLLTKNNSTPKYSPDLLTKTIKI